MRASDEKIFLLDKNYSRVTQIPLNSTLSGYKRKWNPASAHKRLFRAFISKKLVENVLTRCKIWIKYFRNNCHPGWAGEFYSPDWNVSENLYVENYVWKIVAEYFTASFNDWMLHSILKKVFPNNFSAIFLQSHTPVMKIYHCWWHTGVVNAPHPHVQFISAC